VRFAGEEFLDWVRALGVEPGPWAPIPMARPAETDAGVERWLRSALPGVGPLVVLNPSATWPAKAWPLKYFAELSQLLVETAGAQVVVAWGPGEESARDTVVRLADGAARALPSTDLTTLAGFLAAADLVITTDSGPKHLAVAESTPTLTLFGSTDPRGWQPPGREHRWVSHDVPCRPCDLTECVVPGHPCLDDLRPQDVLEEAQRMLAASAGEDTG
jgi:heptosyltransferase-2